MVGVCPQADENWTKIAGPYWLGFVRTVEKTVHGHAYQLDDGRDIRRARCWTDKSTSVLGAMNAMNVTPSGERSAHSFAAGASTGVRSARRAIPQLTFDAMTAAEHVHVAMNVCRPMQLQPTLSPPVGYGTRYGFINDNVCCKQHTSMLALIHRLADALHADRDTILQQCTTVVRAILMQDDHIRHVPLQRGIGYITQSLDWGAIPIGTWTPTGRTCCVGAWNDDSL